MDELHVMEDFFGIRPGDPMKEHDPIDELNKLIKKSKREEDNLQEFFRSTKQFKGQVNFGDHPQEQC